MAGFRLPAGMPGTITWQAKQVGLPAYNLALAAMGSPGHEGHQARFYMSMMMHHRLRGLAQQAAANPQTPAA